MLAYTAGDALHAITREHGITSMPNLGETIDGALDRIVKQIAGRIVEAIRQYRSPSEFDDYAF